MAKICFGLSGLGKNKKFSPPLINTDGKKNEWSWEVLNKYVDYYGPMLFFPIVHYKKQMLLKLYLQKYIMIL